MGKPLLAELREHTRTDHDRLEEMTLGARIMDGTLTAAEYRRIIDWQRRAHKKLEPLARQLCLGAYAYRSRFELPAATRQLVPHSVGTAPPVVEPPLSVAVGTAYVLEGASLGGSVIYRKLLANPRLAEEAPFTFYRQQSEWGLAQWRQFVAALTSWNPSEGERIATVASAQRAFRTFAETWQTSAAD